MIRLSSMTLAKPHINAAAMANKMFTWYPKQGGVFLGNFVAGHNMFIQDVPKKFNEQHAKHFALVESLTVLPLFTLSMVHYFSLYCQYPTHTMRAMPSILTELKNKTESQKLWLDVIQKKSPTEVIAFRAGLLFAQLALFPIWLLVASAAPQLVHATMQHANHILWTKYDCISDGAPPFVAKQAEQCRLAEDFHGNQTALPTDFGVAVVLLLIVLYLTY